MKKKLILQRNIDTTWNKALWINIIPPWKGWFSQTFVFN